MIIFIIAIVIAVWASLMWLTNSDATPQEGCECSACTRYRSPEIQEAFEGLNNGN